ncbi:MAG: DGQHR domain-containing protein [Actinomycetia bacterium]|nr:DGQHR domain-containing protein [Actinomycetes bacterium]
MATSNDEARARARSAEAALAVPVTLRKTTLRRQASEALGVMPAGALVERYVIPRRDFRKKTGYQREPSRARINKLAHDLRKKRVDLPTVVLLNLRDFDPETHLAQEDGHTTFRPGDSPLHVVDGQHRLEALALLVDEDPERWSPFQVSFTCMLGATESEEMGEFYVVNSTAKSVRTDLALDLLKQRAESDPSVMDALIESGESWKVEAQGLTEELSRTSIWSGRIRFPGEPKATTTVGSSGMVNSLRDPLANHYFGRIQRAQQVQLLDAYWKGIASVVPEVFQDPTEYALQKTTGVAIMHRVFIPVLEYLRSAGESLIERDSYRKVLERPLLDLQGDTADGAIAAGPDFWRSEPAGAAGGFSSHAGRRVLSARIKAQLPAPEVA